jgi:hypothetical protein
MKRIDETNPKDRLGVKKVPVGMMYPSIARIETARVFADSAPIYGAVNWRVKKVKASVYIDAIERHMIGIIAGEDIDAKSGLPHLAHVNACTAILMEAKALGNLIDDRFERDPGAAALASYTDGSYDTSRRAIKPCPARTLDQVRAEDARKAAKRRRR